MSMNETLSTQPETTCDKSPLAIHPGPHYDLKPLCVYINEADYKSMKRHADVAFFAHAIEQMIEGKSQEVRLAAAKAALEKNAQCAFAHLIIAREGCKNREEKFQAYETALANLLEESTRHNTILTEHYTTCRYETQDKPCEHDEPSEGQEGYLLFAEIFDLITLEYALLLWEAGEKEKAIAITIAGSEKTNFDKELRASFESVSEGEPTATSGFWLLTLNQEQKAMELLQKSLDGPALPYLHALIKFRQEGNTMTTRAILHHASILEPAQFEYIASNFSPELYDNTEGTKAFRSALQEAWEMTPGAVEWAANCRAFFGGIGKSFTEYIIENSKNPKFKFWRENMDFYNAFKTRGDHKNAKKYIKLALKEAVSLPDLRPFRLSFETACQLVKEDCSIVEDLKSALTKRSQLLLTNSTMPPEEEVIVLSFLGEYFRNLDMNAEAEQHLSRCLKQYQLLEETKPEFVDFLKISATQYNLAYCMGEQKKYQEALQLLESALALQEKYLGKTHWDLVEILDTLRRCLHHLGRHEEEAKIKERMLIIDATANEDSHMHHGPSCPWYVGPCPS
jgi:hypothetical protein